LHLQFRTRQMHFRRKKTTFLIIAIMLSSSTLTAQRITITGKITDTQNRAVIGALIRVQETTIGAIADENGLYSLQNVPVGNQSISVTALGFVERIKEIRATSGKNVILDFVLQESTEELNEVVVVQKSKAEKIREQGYAVAVINTITKKKPTNRCKSTSKGFARSKHKGVWGVGFWFFPLAERIIGKSNTLFYRWCTYGKFGVVAHFEQLSSQSHRKNRGI